MKYNIVDARGRSCPEPVMMTKKALDTLPAVPHRVIVDSMVAVENIKRFVGNKGYSVNAEAQGEDFVISIKK